jgi:hypothetical protein
MGPLMSMVPQCTTDDCTAHKFIEKFFTYRFVMDLKSDFEAIRTRLLHGSATLTMTKALSDLLAEETRLHSIVGSHVSAPHSVLAASHKRGGSRGNSLEPCKHCNKNTHCSEQCFEKYPEKLAEYRSRHAARGRGNPKGSISVAAPQPSWVLDSGASFHVTSDRSQLDTCMPITDGLQFKQLTVHLVLLLIRDLYVIHSFLFQIFLLYLNYPWIYSLLVKL